MINSFLHLLFISVVALFPVINPVGTALMVNPYFKNMSLQDRKACARKIALYAFSICIIFLILGHLILNLFGITIPVIQLAGGILICKNGWDMLNTDPQNTTPPVTQENDATTTDDSLKKISNKIFYPLTFPLTVGGGVISVLFTLGAHAESTDTTLYIVNLCAVIAAIIVMCILIVIIYPNTKELLSRMTIQSVNVLNKFMAFLIFCVGLQIAITGIKNLFNI